MARMEFIYGILLLPFVALSMPTDIGTQSYQALSVRNDDSTDSGGTGGFLDVAIALLPQIQSLVKNITENASADSLKEAGRFKDIMGLFIPFVRKTMEFQAEDEGRSLTSEDFQMLDEIELGLNYIATLTEDAVNTIDDNADVIPDYTYLVDIPDFNIPSLNIPESEIPDITIPEINVPGNSPIPERTIPLQNIPEIDIPGRTVPVTIAPSTLEQRTEKRKEVIRQPLDLTEGPKMRKTSRGQYRPVRIPSGRKPASRPLTVVHSLPGGGYTYSVVN